MAALKLEGLSLGMFRGPELLWKAIPKEFRVPFVGLAGVLLALALLAALVTPNYQPGKYPGAYNSQPEGPSVGESGDDRLAEYTRWLMYFTGILAFGTLALWYVTWRTLQHARQDFDATHRPWISVEVKVGENGLHFDEDETMYVHVETICHNVGNSPAKDVAVHIKHHILHDAKDLNDRRGRDEILGALEAFSTQIGSPPYAETDGIPTIFPGKQYSEYGDRGLFIKPILRQFSGGKPIRLYLLGIVEYGFPFGPPDRHQTRFAYHVGRVTPGVACKIEEITLERDLAQNEVVFSEMLLGSAFYAD